jgi:acetyl esterase/lipase
VNRFKANSTLNQVVRSLPDQSYGFMVRMGSGIAGWIVGTFPFTKFEKMARGIWSSESMAEGMNFLSQEANRQRVFYPIWDEQAKKEDPAKKLTGMAAFVQDRPSQFILICAGGGYAGVATMQEAYPVAKALYEVGYSAFVLQYRTGKAALAPNPLEDLAQALRVILMNAEKFQLNTDDYGIIGFSAGGHLAASFGLENIGYAHYGLPRPGMMILAYPVITMGECTHAGSRDNLLDKNNTQQIDRYSVEKHITERYPKTFLWQCDHDKTVPVENSRLLVQALKNSQVPYVYETFPSDAHGWGLGTGTVAEGWLDRALEFWQVG